jgi:glycine cleavage system H lipoate-binding protein
MKLWDEWEYKTNNIEYDKDGNEIVTIKISVMAKDNRGDIVDAFTSFLEGGLK